MEVDKGLNLLILINCKLDLPGFSYEEINDYESLKRQNQNSVDDLDKKNFLSENRKCV